MDWLLVSLLPGLENRAGIPLAILRGVNPFVAWIISSLLSFAAGLLVLLFLSRLEELVLLTPLSNLYKAVSENVRKRVYKYVEKYGRFALPVFVAVPMPGSGVYSGALAAFLLGMKKEEALVGLLVGSFLSGLIVLIASASLRALISPLPLP